MTPEQIAEQLNGIEYPDDIPEDVARAAKTHGIVIVFGASDDLMEFRGAIYDEVGCYDGGTTLLDAKGPLPHWEQAQESEKDAREYFERKPKARSIEALWSPAEPEGATWAYRTDIPHVTFDVMEDGAIWCRGLVFSLAKL